MMHDGIKIICHYVLYLRKNRFTDSMNMKSLKLQNATMQWAESIFRTSRIWYLHPMFVSSTHILTLELDMPAFGFHIFHFSSTSHRDRLNADDYVGTVIQSISTISSSGEFGDWPDYLCSGHIVTPDSHSDALVMSSCDVVMSCDKAMGL